MSNRVYVIAFNVYEFKSYVDKKASEYENPIVIRINNPYGYQVGNEVHCTEYINVGSIDTIRGYRDINGVFVGTYYNRDDIWDIITYISVRKNKDIVSTLPEKHRELLKVTPTTLKSSDYQYNCPTTGRTYTFPFGTDDTMSMPSLTMTPPMPIINVIPPLPVLNIPPPLLSDSTFKINPIDTTSDTIIPPKAPPFITSIDITITRKPDNKNG